MLLKIGRGMAPLNKSATINIVDWDLTSSIPSELTYTRNDAVATYRDSNGDLQQSSIDAARFDHDASGTALGLRFEGLRQNKCENYNINPTDSTGFTTTGDPAGVITVEDQSTALANANLDKICTNGDMYKFDNSAGVGTFTVRVNGQVGNTNAHCLRAFVKTSVTGYHGTFKLVGGSNTVAMSFSDTDIHELILENQTPTATSRTVEFNIPAGKTIYMILNQLEEGSFCSSPIVVQGAAATRQAEHLVNTALNTALWFDENQGAAIAKCRFDNTSGDARQYVFIASEGTGTTNVLGVRMNDGTAHMRAHVNSSGGGSNLDDVHKPLVGQRFPVGLTWKSGETTAIAGPCRFNTDTHGTDPASIDRLEIGTRPFNEAMFGHIENLKIYTGHRSVEQLGADMIEANDKMLIGGGQSNMNGYFRSQVGNDNLGEAALINELDVYWTTTRNWVANAARDGSFALKANDPMDDNWWYDDVATEFGPAMAYWEDVAKACQGKIQAFLWDQGESDSASTKTDYKAALLAIFNRMRTAVGTHPVVVVPIGRRSDSENTGYNNLREAQRELASENAWIHLAPEKIFQPLSDSVHLTDAGYAAQAPLVIRKMMDVLGETVTGGVDGPTITSAVRTGTSIAVTISHDGGTDFTPTTGIEGFKFFDDATEIAVTAAVRTNATTITLTLASTPTGVETLYYGYGTLFNEVTDPANVVRDNDFTHNLPLRTTKVVL